MNTNDRKKVLNELMHEVTLYNDECIYMKTFCNSDQDMWSNANAKRRKILHRLRGMIDIANICDKRYVYRLEYAGVGMFDCMRLDVEKVEG